MGQEEGVKERGEEGGGSHFATQACEAATSVAFQTRATASRKSKTQ